MEILRDLKEQFPKNEWLGHLTKTDQCEALCLLLENEEFDDNAVNYGFKEALFNMVPRCLDSIAKYALKRGVTFSLANPYNFLFTTGKRSRKNRLAECTKVLIDSGFDLEENASETGWYPLYTLMKHAQETCTRGESLEAELTSLSLLLEAGADPNFRFGPRSSLRKYQVGSATEALARGLRLCRPYGLSLEYHKHVSQSILLLVKYGCDMSKPYNTVQPVEFY